MFIYFSSWHSEWLLSGKKIWQPLCCLQNFCSSVISPPPLTPKNLAAATLQNTVCSLQYFIFYYLPIEEKLLFCRLLHDLGSVLYLQFFLIFELLFFSTAHHHHLLSALIQYFVKCEPFLHWFITNQLTFCHWEWVGNFCKWFPYDHLLALSTFIVQGKGENEQSWFVDYDVHSYEYFHPA